jgi:hypothetical protein
VFLSLKLIVSEGWIPCIIPLGSCVSLVMKYVLVVLMAACAWGQGPGKEIGSGAGDIGKGAAKGAGNLAKGTGKGALDLVTLHPINAATSLGKGAGAAGKDVTVGSVKGTGKIGKGIGKAVKKLF